MAKIKVAILFGGANSEHAISCLSAASIIKNLDPKRFIPVPISIDQQGIWRLQALDTLVFDQQGAVTVDKKQPQLTLPPFPTPELSQLADVFFPALHGVYYEDGSLQGLFEMWRVPYVGATVLGSAISMEKSVAKELITGDAVLQTPEYLLLTQANWQHHAKRCMDHIMQRLTWPLFVKPNNTGSSIGVAKVTTEKDLIKAINYAFQLHHHVIVEQGVIGREIEIAVLENIEQPDQPIVSAPVEIKTKEPFYNFKAKYDQKAQTEFLLPAPLDEDALGTLQALAIMVFKRLQLSSMARIDFLYSNHIWYFNEANTIPGFTAMSMYPRLWQNSGVAYQTLLSKLIDLALSRKKAVSQPLTQS